MCIFNGALSKRIELAEDFYQFRRRQTLSKVKLIPKHRVDSRLIFFRVLFSFQRVFSCSCSKFANRNFINCSERKHISV